MFPEFQDRVKKLMSENPHFAAMYQKHADLDHFLDNVEQGHASATSLEIEKLKKEKLHLKDQIYALLRAAS
jgi:uncharacterized protein YdcH (DUF465 family)